VEGEKMKIDIIKYNNFNDFVIVVGGKAFNASTEYSGFIGQHAITQYILEKKFNARLVRGSKTICGDYITFMLRGQDWTYKVGEESHTPNVGKYWMNVVAAHIKKLTQIINEINNSPLYSFEV
jgi:hypothetical protein